MVSVNIDRVVKVGRITDGELEDFILKMLYEAGGVLVDWENLYQQMFYVFDKTRFFLPATHLCSMLNVLLDREAIREICKGNNRWFGLAAGAWLRLASAE